MIINLGFSGLAISFGVLLLKFLRYFSSSFGDFSKEIIFSLPVFPFILIGSLLIRYILEKTKNTDFISNILQREIGILSTDLLIFTAMASLNIAVVFDNWLIILFFTIFGIFYYSLLFLLFFTIFYYFLLFFIFFTIRCYFLLFFFIFNYFCLFFIIVPYFFPFFLIFY